MLILNLWRLSTFTGLGKFNQLFLWEPENSKISNYLHCCCSYQLQWRQSRARTPCLHGQLLEMPMRHLQIPTVARSKYIPLLLAHKGILAQKKLSFSLEFRLARPHPHREAGLTPPPRCVDVKRTPPEPRVFCSSPSSLDEDWKSFTGLFSWTASEAASFPHNPAQTSPPQTLKAAFFPPSRPELQFGLNPVFKQVSTPVDVIISCSLPGAWVEHQFFFLSSWAPFSYF